MSEEIIIDGVSSENGFISNPKRGLTTEITRLKQENEFLIRKYEASLKNNEAKTLSWIEFQGCKKENERLKQENEELKEKFLTLNGKSYSYYIILQEIKEIAEDAYKNDEQYQSTGIYNEIIEKVNGILEKE